jgi:RNA 3'-terminal phosphate cyclase (ATP)
MIELDGAQGEGGGQILRSALSLSMITGKPFRLHNIRANRNKPGLLRQHLIAVQAAAQICDAQGVNGIALGARELSFIPGQIKGGNYTFAIGSAGSCTLVLQTLLPALWHAQQASEIQISGGTHNAMAPPAQFLQQAYGGVLTKMGVQVSLELQRFGFYPAGGGKIIATVQPCPVLQKIELLERGARVKSFAESFVAAVPFRVAQKELACVGEHFGWNEEQLFAHDLPVEQGPGNALLISLLHEQVNEVFCAFGERGVSSENVAKTAIRQARQYLASQAALGEYLADQVMLPFALAGGGSFSASCISQHALTNAEVIEKFLPVKFVFEKQAQRHLCSVHPQ